MHLKLYELCCHGCGKVYTLNAEYLSLPAMIEGPDGAMYGARACEKCMEDGNKIQRAYDAYRSGNFEEFKLDHWSKQ